jgi:beta-N-acetylhexosaminidase
MDKSLREHAGRYLIIGLDPEGSGEIAPSLALVDEIRPFGVILFARNMPSIEHLLRLNHALLDHTPNLLLSIDHEGGRVHRLPPPFTRFPPALRMAHSGDPGFVREVAHAQAVELRAAGFHINFAPVLDVHTNPANPVIGDRAFGTTPEEVIHHALPYLQGLAEGGIIGCGKHFPGHGDTALDSHLALPLIEHDVARLQSLELVPFARAVAHSVPMIMTAHVLCPALDPELPASLSRAAVTGLLRERMHYRGIVVSDDLEMKAVADHWGIGESAVRALEAGSDLVLVCKTPDFVREAHAAIANALALGQIPAAEQIESDRRRAKLESRARRGTAEREDPLEVVGSEPHREIASRYV